MKTFFNYQHDANFDIESDASATFTELLTRHKSTVAEYLNNNYDWVSAIIVENCLDVSIVSPKCIEFNCVRYNIPDGVS